MGRFKVSTTSFGLIFYIRLVRWQKEVAVEFVNPEGLELEEPEEPEEPREREKSYERG